MFDTHIPSDRHNTFDTVYQNYPNKFLQLRALQTKHAEEVAYVLKNMFLTFGASCALYTDNGRDFTKLVNVQLQRIWRVIEILLSLSSNSGHNCDKLNIFFFFLL